MRQLVYLRSTLSFIASLKTTTAATTATTQQQQQQRDKCKKA